MMAQFWGLRYGLRCLAAEGVGSTIPLQRLSTEDVTH